MQTPASKRRLHRLPARDRRERSSRTRHSRHRRQPVGPQVSRRRTLARSQHTLPSALHPDVCVVAQSRRAVLWTSHRGSASGAGLTPAFRSFVLPSPPTSTPTTRTGNPSSGPRPPTRSSTRCAASVSAHRKRTKTFLKKSRIQGTRSSPAVRRAPRPTNLVRTPGSRCPPSSCCRALRCRSPPSISCRCS